MVVHVISQVLNLLLYSLNKFTLLPTFQVFLYIIVLILLIKIIYYLVCSI